MQELLRLLDVVRRELGADDARAEIGGREPSAGTVWTVLPSGLRIVAVFDEPPEDADAKRARLETLVSAFEGAEQALELAAPSPSRDAAAATQLFDALDALVALARAESAAVIDGRSPEIWGSSLAPRGPRDMDEAAQLTGAIRLAKMAGLDFAELLAGDEPRIADALMESGALRPGQAIELEHRIAEIREAGARLRHPSAWRLAGALCRLRDADTMGMPREDPQRIYLVKPLGGYVYRLVIVFPEKGASPLHAEAAMIKALPVIESLVERLPPRDPGPGKGAVVRRLRPV